MGLTPKSQAGAPTGPSPPSVVAPQGGLGAGTVRETWAVGHQRCSPLAGRMPLLAIPHALDTLTGWTMDRYIGHSISL